MLTNAHAVKPRELSEGVVRMTGRSRSKDLVKAEHVIEVIYRDGVFRPREAVDLEEGKRLKIRVDHFAISKYYGAFGKASANELERLEEELLFDTSNCNRAR